MMNPWTGAVRGRGVGAFSTLTLLLVMGAAGLGVPTNINTEAYQQFCYAFIFWECNVNKSSIYAKLAEWSIIYLTISNCIYS